MDSDFRWMFYMLKIIVWPYLVVIQGDKYFFTYTLLVTEVTSVLLQYVKWSFVLSTLNFNNLSWEILLFYFDLFSYY